MKKEKTLFSKSGFLNFKSKTILMAALMLGSFTAATAGTFNVTVKDSYGTPLPGVKVQYVTSQFYNLGLGLSETDGSGFITGTVPNNAMVGVKLFYNNTSYSMASIATGLDQIIPLEFETSRLTIKAKSCGTPVNGQSASFVNGYPTGSWLPIGATANDGSVSKEIFPFDNLKVKLLTNGNSYQEKVIADFDYGQDKCVEFDNLIKLAAPGTSWLIGSSWIPGNAGRYAFPGTYTVRVFYGANYVDETIPLTEGMCTFDKTVVVIKVVDHNNNGIPGAYVRGGNTTIGWHVGPNGVPAPTNAQGILIDWKPGNAARIYEARYNASYSATQTKNTALAGGQLFIFKTSLLNINLKNCGNGVPGGHVRFGLGNTGTEASINSHWPYNNASAVTNGSGVISGELFPGTFTMQMNINGTNQYQVFNFTGINELDFDVTKVLHNYGANKVALNGAVWINSGAYMFPGTTYDFRIYTPATVWLYDFAIAGCETILALPPARVAAPALSNNASSSIYPNPAVSSINISLPEGAGTADVKIITLDGRLVLNKVLEPNNSSVNVSELPAGIYQVGLTVDGKSQMHRLVIAK